VAGGYSSTYPKTWQRRKITRKLSTNIIDKLPGKIMERILNKRLVQVLDDKNLLAEQQYGFRTNWSTTDELNILNTLIIEAICKKAYSAMLSLDISRAYETCWRRGILNILKPWIINGKIFEFDKNFMSN
jgi:hypothetical protein